MKKNILLLSLALGIVALLYLQVISSHRPKSEIVIGVIAPLSGPIAAFGEEIGRGIKEVTPSDIKVIYEDEACDPKTSITAFKKLTELDHATIIIGPACGASQKAIAPLVANSGAIVITPTAAPEELYSLSNGMMFNIQYSLEDESMFIAKKIYDLGYKNVAIITYKNAFSEVHNTTFTKEYRGSVVTTIFLDDTSTTIDTDLLKLSKMKFDALYITDISFFFTGGVEKLTKNKITTPVFATYVVELPLARALVKNVIYSFPKDITGDDGGTYALSKDTAKTLFPIAIECKGVATCVQKKLLTSTDFSAFGIKKRDIVLKQITGNTTKLLMK